MQKRNNNWKESEHPRDEEGKFTEKGNGIKSVEKGEVSKEPLSKAERYYKFIVQWELMSERYNNVQYDPKNVYTQIYHDEVDKFFGDELSRWTYSISNEQLQSIYQYTISTNKLINGVLRANGKFLRNGADKDRIMRQIDLLSSALADFDLQHNILVYRAEERNRKTERELVDNNVFTLKGFTSTSIERRIVDINTDCIQYQIEVPAGKGRGAYISGFSAFEKEYEFLIQRDTKVKVLRQLDDGEFKIVRLRVVDE